MLVEIHILQNHAPSNLNRDDTGSPKDAIFGGYRRARISSQCLKRSIRKSDIFREKLGESLAFRTRKLPELVKEKLRAWGIVDEKMLEIAARKASGFGTTDGKEGKPNASGHYRTAQTMFLSDHDVEAVACVFKKAVKAVTDAKTPEKFEKTKSKDLENDASLKGFRPITVDSALFGRMVTSEAFLDVDASCQFAHAISTNKFDHEFDYYTAVDDLERSADDEAGAGADMIGDVEFTSACFYKYFNVHIDGLIENLTGKAFGRGASADSVAEAKKTAAAATCVLLEAACRVTPSGKQNTFAAHQLPALVWVEVRNENLPISYSNAFVTPVSADSKSSLEVASANAFKTEVERLKEMYGLMAEMRLLLAKDNDFEILDTSSSPNLQEISSRLEGAILSWKPRSQNQATAA